MRISLGSDHAAVDVRHAIAASLTAQGHTVVESGPEEGERTDYPSVAADVARAVSTGAAERGVLVCGTGIGMSIAANKFPRVRAALVHDPYTAEMAAQHNDANILCLGGRLLATYYACHLVNIWLNTAFEERHFPRLKQIAALDSSLPLPTLEERSP